MGNTFFYQKAKHDANKITWGEILSETFVKHTKKDRDYALSAGNSFNTSTEQDMLQKWKKPWLWFRALIWGIAVFVVLFLVVYVQANIINVSFPIFYYMLFFISPVVVPLALMIFCWELNVPRNISFGELILYFIAGAIFSLLITSILWVFITQQEAQFAPFREEPAKIIPAAILLYIYSRKRKIYGVTGLVIGSAVGAGFAGFESVQYAFMTGSTENVIVRAVFAIGGHVTWCALYTAGLALDMKDGKFKAEGFVGKHFPILFLFAVACHFTWNYPASVAVSYLKYISLSIVEMIVLLWMIKKCMHQVVSMGRYYSGQGVNPDYMGAAAPPQMAMGMAPQMAMGAVQSRPLVANVTICCVSGMLKGAIWKSDGKDVIAIGRGEGNHISFPQTVKGVSRQHCIIQRTLQGWMLKDLNSSYGTYLANGQRLAPGIDVALNDGDYIYIGGKDNALQIRMQ